MEGTAVVEVCERVIVALVLNAQLFKRVGGRILGKADLRAVFVCRLDAKVALFAAWQTDVVEHRAVGRGGVGARALKALQKLAETLRC